MPDLEQLLSSGANTEMFPVVVRQLLREYHVKVEEAVPSPEEVQLATELAYVLSNMEPPQFSGEGSVFSSVLGRLVLYSQNKGAVLDNDWKILAQDAMLFHESLFAQAAACACMSMYLLLGGNEDTSEVLATAVCALAQRVLPKDQFVPLIRYGWGEQHFQTPLPLGVGQVLEESARA